MEKLWYAIHTYAGYENKVKANLEKRAESMNMEDYIFRIIVPMEDEVQVKDGQKKIVKHKVFPGYVLVEMVMSDYAWYVVRNTPGVTGFVGAGNKPVALHPEEAEAILKSMGMGEAAKIYNDFYLGEKVRIIGGPFAGQLAVVDEISPDRGKLWVLIQMFGGRETKMEMESFQVEKLS